MVIDDSARRLLIMEKRSGFRRPVLHQL